MGYGAYMRALLRPLGIYRMKEGDLSFSETEALGGELDGVEAALESAEQEGQIAHAGEAGLTSWAKLFAHPPAAEDTDALREAVAALLRIGEGSFTVEAINATIGGCGVQCLVEETERYGTVRVSFPSVAGIPEQFERKRIIIEEIIPCHLEIDYFFRFMTWAICESKGYTWGRVKEESHNWGTFALAVN